MLNQNQWMDLIERLSIDLVGFEKRKLNFAGGEPTLIPYLPELIRHAKARGFYTGLVSNGWGIDAEFLRRLAGSVDVIGISIDSLESARNKIFGRRHGQNATGVSGAEYRGVCRLIQSKGILLKINTVVKRLNLYENMRPFLLEIQPDKWKVMQFLVVEGQNEGSREMRITELEFSGFVSRHEGITGLVAECNDDMIDSYVMIAPDGRPYSNTKGCLTYGKSLLDQPLLPQLDSLGYDFGKTRRRKGFDFSGADLPRRVRGGSPGEGAWPPA